MEKKYQNVEILYKYRTFNNVNHLNWLTKNEIFFASPEIINDPIDCKMRVRLEEASEFYLRKYFYRTAKREGLSNYETREITNKTLSEIRQSKNKKKYFDKINDKHINYSTGVLSFSTFNSNIQMWNDYADYRKGFCIGYNNQLLQKALWKMADDYNKLNNEDLLISPFDCQYVSNIPIITLKEYLDYNDEESYNFNYKIITTKLNKYAYESEVRFISYGKDKTNLTFKMVDELFDCVIIGEMISSENEKKIINILRKKIIKIPLFKGFFFIMKNLIYKE